MSLISKTQLFLGSTELESTRLIKCFDAPQKKYKPGETIYVFGESYISIGILKSGSAKIVQISSDGEATLLETINDGGIFGERIAFTSLPQYNVSVVAEKDCVAIFLPLTKLLRPCRSDCDCHRVLINNLFAILSKKTADLSERVQILSCRNIRDKLLCFFRINSYKEASRNFILPFSLSYLAEYICSDRSAMMREMKKLKTAGVLKAKGRYISLSADFFDESQE